MILVGFMLEIASGHALPNFHILCCAKLECAASYSVRLRPTAYHTITKKKRQLFKDLTFVFS